jgi:hypothetical protein
MHLALSKTPAILVNVEFNVGEKARLRNSIFTPDKGGLPEGPEPYVVK